MKYLMLLLLINTQTSLGGNPDQDLIVDLVRERYAASRQPTMSDIKLGKTWKCAIYSAQRGILPNYNNYQELFLFEQTGPSTITNKKNFLFTEFEFTKTGLVSTSTDSSLFVRVANNSALVFENVGKQPKHHKAYRSVTDNKLRGLDFIYCK